METSLAKEICKRSVAAAVEICGTQENLAKKAKITQGAIGKYLRGEALPKGQTAKNLSLAVDGVRPPSDFAPHIFDAPDEGINQPSQTHHKKPGRRRSDDRRGVNNPPPNAA